MKLCIAGKNNIAVDSVKYLLNNNLISKNKLLILPNNGDNGVDDWQNSLKKISKKQNLGITQLEEIYNYEDLIFISLEYNKIIKPSNFKSKKLFNIHFSSLPKYKGMYTSIWPILNGENTSGVTLHKIDNGIDTGDIIDQKIFKISINWTARDLYFNYLINGYELFKKNIVNLINNNFTCYKQSNILSSYYSKRSLNFTNINIDLNKTAFEIHNQLRAFIFYEYQLPIIEKSKIIKSVLTNKKINRINKVEEYENYYEILGVDKYIVKAYKKLNN